jgi:hypothetical protein
MSYEFDVVTEFTLADGRSLLCEYKLTGEHDTWNDMGWTEHGEPTYTLDGVEVTEAQMPKGLAHIAEQMHDCPYWTPREETETDNRDYEP